MVKMLKRNWVGRYVRLLHATRNNGGDQFSAGETLRVVENRGGLVLEKPYRCPHCNGGYSVMISERDVVLLDTDYQPTLPIDYAVKLAEAGRERDLAQKSTAILRAIVDLANQDKPVGFESDVWEGNTLTLYIGDAHTHVGVPDGTFEQLVDSLHGQLVEHCGLSFVRDSDITKKSVGATKEQPQ